MSTRGEESKARGAPSRTAADRQAPDGDARGPAWTAPATAPVPVAPTDEFVRACAEAGIEFDEGDVERLGSFLALLMDANRSISLTAIREEAEAWMKHVFDSLTLLQFLADLVGGARVIDVGSGGGVPGVPLAICVPHVQFTLLEATGKKAAYLREVARAMGLANVTVVNERAEKAGHDRGAKVHGGREGGHREAYDVAVARAVGPMATVAELTVPFAKVGGRVLLIKGAKAEEELAEAGEALRRLHAVHAGTVATPTGRIVVLGKASATPRDYPRREGEAKRVPLGSKRNRAG